MKIKITSEFYATSEAIGVIVPAGESIPEFSDKRLWTLINPVAMELRKYVTEAVEVAVGEPYDITTRHQIVMTVRGKVDECLACRKLPMSEALVVCDNTNNPPLIRNWNGGMLDYYHLTVIDVYFALMTWEMGWTFYLETI